LLENINVHIVSSQFEVIILERVKTGCKELDEELEGGFVPKRQASIFGPPDIGKTVLALQTSCKLSIREDESVLYLDTEGDFCDERTANKYIDFLGDRFGGDPEIEFKFVPDVKSLSRLLGKKLKLIQKESKMETAISEIDPPQKTKIAKRLNRMSACCLVLDSISAPIEETFVASGQNYPARADLIRALTSVMKVLAAENEIPIIQTVHQTKNPMKPWSKGKATGGIAYGHATKTKVQLQSGKGGTYKAFIRRHAGKYVDDTDLEPILLDLEKDFGFTGA